MKKTIILLAVMIFMFMGCGGCGKKDEEKQSTSKKAGEKLGKALTEFTAGVGEGVDKTMLIQVELSKDLTDKGIINTISKAGDIGMSKEISVYFTSKEPFKGKMIAKALNKEQLEIGRAIVDVAFAADDAKYITFKFNDEMDTQLVGKYLIDIKK